MDQGRTHSILVGIRIKGKYRGLIFMSDCNLVQIQIRSGSPGFECVLSECHPNLLTELPKAFVSYIK